MIEHSEANVDRTLDAGWGRIADLVEQAFKRGRDHIPSSVMLDYAYGGLDEELLDALYGDHLSECASCRRAVEVYSSYRPQDAARLFEIPEFAGTLEDREEYELSPVAAGKRLRDYVAAGAGSLLVVAGEANPEVYDWELGEVLRDRAKRSGEEAQPVLQFICGPAMGLNDRIPTKEEAVLPRLAEEGFVKLFISEHRQRFHFRVSGEDHVYTEAYHRAGNTADRQGYWYKSGSIAAMLKRRFQALLTSAKARPATADDFEYLSMDTIRDIESLTGDKFDSMTREDLKTWLHTHSDDSSALA